MINRRQGRRAAVAAIALTLGVAAVALAFRLDRGSSEPAASLGESPAATAWSAEQRDRVMAISGGTFEPSGVAWVPGTNAMLFVDDDRSSELLLLELTPSGTQAGTPVSIPLGADVRDMEGITTDGRHFYVVGSQSKKDGFDGDGLVRFTFDPATRQVGSVESVRALKAWLAANVPELRGTEKRVGDDVVNIEGLAWDPARRRLLLGFRAPQVGVDALIVPIRLADTTGAFTGANLRVDGASIRIPLGGAGIRSIEHDATTNAFQIIAGAGLNDENVDFRVFEWSGEAGSAVRQIGTYSRTLKPEGFTRATLGGQQVGVMVFDVGSFAVRAAAMPR